jgi:hypothetical protein
LRSSEPKVWFGFGGKASERTKAVKSAISCAVSWRGPPSSDVKAALKCASVARSPRQWSGVLSVMPPRKVCVVIGPFIGCSPEVPPVVVTMSTDPCGLPKSQASPSRWPFRWQLAHETVPCCERSALWSNFRPARTSRGSGLLPSARRETSPRVPVSTTLRVSSKRLRT